MSALASSGLAPAPWRIQRCDSLSDKSRRSCETARRPLRVHTWPLNRPRQLPSSASTASIGCSSTPRPLPLPISPSPRRRLAVVAKLISLVSWIASIMAAFCRRRRAVAPALDHPCGRHLGIAEKAVEPHFPSAVALCQPPQADILARDHAFDERRPPLSRRRSPNRPNDQSICASMSTPLPKPKCRNRNHMNSRFWNPLRPSRVNPSHQMCASPSAFAGTTICGSRLSRRIASDRFRAH